jgi:beta-alanine--pyruvate transaminase
LKLLKEEALFARAGQMGKLLGDAIHSALKGTNGVVSIRTLGLAGAIELASIPGSPGKRAYDIFLDCYHAGVLVRPAGENIVLCPPYIVSAEQIAQMVEVVVASIRRHPA